MSFRRRTAVVQVDVENEVEPAPIAAALGTISLNAPRSTEAEPPRG